MFETGLLCCFLFLSGTVFAVFGQSCDRETMRRCRQDVLRDIESQSGRDSKQQCKQARENFDCLLWQTSMCLDRQQQESNRDAILRAWRFLAAFCEDEGSWYTLACFQREEVKRCEGLMPSKSSSTDSSSCRSFGHFRDCVRSAVQQCSSSDRRLLGTYLMEKGQQRAWNCPAERIDPASAPLAADTRYTSLTESSYGYCSDESRSSLRECRNTFEQEQREAQTRNDSDMRNHKTCCALVKYETCVTEILEDRCGERGKSEARSLVSDMKNRFPYYNCDDHGENECSGATILSVTHSCLLVLAMVTAFLASKKEV
ncbi:uncharacterized protein LOC129230695 [Uloborus diversus]|uniref:uncharacterized protein LOC129230695 n=1 Tax=Uloborus diversus TaxID=327109 RepID=UPI002408F6DB|nr:uncharacterized protein LOC129230695 [Uloborus diversus]